MRKAAKAFLLLFHPAPKGFERISTRDETGTYAHSFAAYKRLQWKARIMFCFSVSLVVAASLTFSIYFPFITGREPRPVMATAVSWDGGGDGSSWSSAGNWNNDAIPGADSDVTINTSTTVNIAAVTTINSLTLDDAGSVAPILNFSYDAVGTSAPLVLDAGNLVVDTGATITHTVGTTVVVGSIYIDVQTGTTTIDGTIDAKSKGFAGGNVASDGSGTGKGIYDSANSGNGGGGGHGGAGGQGNSSGSTGGGTYGSSTAPVTAGSGGAGGFGANTIGTVGGGIIRINSRGNMAIGGTIQANTASGLTITTSGKKCGGTGAGGSIYLTTEGTISGAGTLNASGAKGRSCTVEAGNTGGGGGGGGYIRREFVASTFSGTVTVAGGAGGDGPSGNGSAGTDGVSSTKTYSVPSTPSIASPSSGSVTSSLTPTITSSSYSGDITHRQSDWEIDDNADFSSPTFSSYDDTTNKTSITVSSVLAPNVTYYARTRQSNGAGDSVYSTSAHQFTTIANTPSAPTVVTISASSLSVVVNENSNPASTEFAIRLTPQGQTAQYLQADGTLGTNAAWQTDSVWGTKSITGLSANTTYAIDVKARNSGNTETEFSFTSSAATSSGASNNPVVSSLSDSTLSVVIDESGLPSTTTYAIAIVSNATTTYLQADGTLGTTVVYQTYTQWGRATGTTIVNLSPNTAYAIQIKAKDSNGTITNLGSSVSSVTRAMTPQTPTAANVTSSSLQLALPVDNNPSTTEYAISVSSHSLSIGSSDTLSDTPVWRTRDAWNAVTIGQLSPNVLYIFQVKARNSAGVETELSPLLAFYTLASTIDDPLIQNATRNANGNVDVDIVLSQDENPETTEYAIRVTNIDTEATLYIQADHTIGSTILWQRYGAWVNGDDIVNITGLSAQENYTIIVLTRNGDGVESEGSPSTFAFSTFQLPKVPKGIIVKQQDDTTVKITWNAADRATTYRIQLRRAHKSNKKHWKKWNGIIKTTVTVKKLRSSKKYQTRIRACNDSGCSKFTKWKMFQLRLSS